MQSPISVASLPEQKNSTSYNELTKQPWENWEGTLEEQMASIWEAGPAERHGEVAFY